MRKSAKALILFSVVVLSFSYGFLCSKYGLFPYSVIEHFYQAVTRSSYRGVPVRDVWREARKAPEDEGITDEEKASLSELAGLPYLTGYNPASKENGVTIYNDQLAYQGLNFFVSAHAPKAFLMDMKGNILHEWGIQFEQVWPEPLPFEIADRFKTYWRRALLLENGDVLAIFEGIGLVRLDKDSNLMWSYLGRTHHDLCVDEDGLIYVLARKERSTHDKVNLEGPILEDFIVVLSPEGQELRRLSILDALLNSDYASVLEAGNKRGDIFHTNTIELITGKISVGIPAFKSGSLLVSLCTLNTIAVVDMDAEKVTWALSGCWHRQHQPTLLENGNLMVFDNLGNNGKSKVIEFNPLTQEVVWAYRGDSTNELLSESNGSNQRLPNGNTLIIESNFGRAFEVTPENEIVWEFLNPNRAGKENELIATLCDLVRIDYDQVAFLDGSK
jgi:hypothetical protein